MTALVMFPGQGSQRPGMCATALRDRHDLVVLASEIAGFDISEASRSADLLRKTQYVQPTVFVAEYVAYLRNPACGEAVLAGHSLGELAALCAAGAVDFESGVGLAAERGRLMASVPAGGMVAVMGVSPSAVETILSEELTELDVANYNGDRQVVISGPHAALDVLCERVDELGGLAVGLNVDGAFHSRSMRAAAREFTDVLARLRLAAPSIPVYSNVTAELFPEDSAAIADLMVRQLFSPVRWTEILVRAMEAGVERFVEVGPGTVLTGIAERMIAARGWSAGVAVGEADAA
ncbi:MULTISPECIES: ACP S-malonyltransferase [Tsukamurella]|uniref:Malonyl CoA-acyl carrier protein transacylase n=1 Tax=Tsukamurella strandjordii TaxID=147577 RepID=A0AA90N8T2_9ACTN|nr:MULTISPECIES: ACP S-malonyltransferase [Tsukamurella]MDP0396985.1 ACP S-malonyltransferase [Tsukamurella strandjordii]GIZ96787.1 hypothetical protein TTY48_13990 [Tsukamurella sp. TY48]